MAKLEIQTGENNPILRKRSEEIARIDSGLKKFAKEMKKTMIEKDGLGLAAPQVGENIRMIVVNLNAGTKNAVVMPMINPKILGFSFETEIAEEGCLSLPGQYAKVERAHAIKLKFSNIDGDEQIMDLEALNARIVQHEVDHIDGILFVDRVKEDLEQKRDLAQGNH